MGLEIEYIEGQTPLDEDEKEGLLIKSITSLIAFFIELTCSSDKLIADFKNSWLMVSQISVTNIKDTAKIRLCFIRLSPLSGY